VTQIVGEASVDTELLAKRVEAVAAFIEDGQNKQSLHVNPQDLPLLQDQEFGFALTPDDNVARGCVRLDTADGWIEDGPDIQLSRLKTMLDDMEGKG
jgi:flagellar assembly protein FliH